MNALKLVFLFFFIVCSRNISAQSANTTDPTTKHKLDSVIFFTGEKIEYFYNDFGQNKGLIHSSFLDTKMEYTNDYLKEFSYNTKGLCASEILKLWNSISNDFVESTKNEFTYDDKMQPLSIKNFVWSSNSNKWEFNKQTDFENTYDGHNRIIESILYEKVKDEPEPKISKYEYSYRPSGRLKSAIFYNAEDSLIKPFEREYFIYEDSEGYMTKKIHSFYVDGSWDTKSTLTYGYNKLDSTIEVFIPTNYYLINLMLPTNIKYDYLIEHISHNFHKDNERIPRKYYYSLVKTDITTKQEFFKIDIYPNPATDFLNFKINSDSIFFNAELYNLAGDKLLDKQIKNNSKMSVQDYAKGVYLLRILDNDKIIQTKKICFN